MRPAEAQANYAQEGLKDNIWADFGAAEIPLIEDDRDFADSELPVLVSTP